MTDIDDDESDIVAEAVAVARDVAEGIGSIVITHYADADTLDILRPGMTDLAIVRRINLAVAGEFAALGVKVFVQRADRAAFRRWLDGHPDPEQNRLAWIDRGRLLPMGAGLKLLGVFQAPDVAPPAPGKVPGPHADRLVETYADEDDTDFRELAEIMIAAGRDDIIELALRKTRDQLGDEAADNVAFAFREIAEAGDFGPSGWAELVALPMALIPGSVPEAGELSANLVGSGALSDTLEVRFLPGWRSPDALAELHATKLRRVLLDLIAGQEPRDLPPGDTDDLAASGFGVLVGLQIDWDIPVWEDVFLNGVQQQPDEDEETPQAAERAAVFERWRLAVAEASGGCVALRLVRPTQLPDELSGFMDEAGAHARGIEDIRDFVAMVRREANDEEVVCRLKVMGQGLEISLYTKAGRFLDTLTLPASRLPAPVGEMAPLIEAFLSIVQDAPQSDSTRGR
jgi:hypothetical protein